ncbi:MAG: SDR family oxidoreductase [Bacilli bacterium]|nr:SDR family oxidoreductase [Bacilli bacterium]
MNKVIIITGGANGLGRELVKESLNRGLYVCNIDCDIEGMNKMSQEYRENYKGFIGDVSDEKFIKETVESISKIGDIRIIINNAGEPSFKMPTNYTNDDINKCFKGLRGMILCSTEVLKVKNEQNLKIVNIMSSAALRGNKQEAVYCATKWGEKGYTESLKVAYKGTSVKVIGVYPGGINTNFYKNSRDYVSEEKQASFMNPKDVAETILSNVINDKNLTVTDLIIERNS